MAQRVLSRRTRSSEKGQWEFDDWEEQSAPLDAMPGIWGWTFGAGAADHWQPPQSLHSGETPGQTHLRECICQQPVGHMKIKTSRAVRELLKLERNGLGCW